MREHTQIPELLLMLDSFLLDCEARSLRPSTIQAYRDYNLWFLEFVRDKGIFRVEDITAQHVRAYLVSLQARGWAQTSIASAYRMIRVFFNFLLRDEVIDRSPMAKVAIPKEDKRLKSAFTAVEIKKMLAAAVSQRDKALIMFLLDTGARISEVLAVDVGDVDFATGRVFLHHTKDREQRIVYLGSQARRQLLKYYRQLAIRPDAPLWIDLRRGKRLLRNGVTQLLRRIGSRAGVFECGPHKFRRTFAVTFLRNGGDIFTLQRILGHSSLDMVKQYLGGLNDDDTAKAHKLYAPGDRMA
jgi:site-specific recombinase XerD